MYPGREDDRGVTYSKHFRLQQVCQTSLEPLPLKWDLFKLRLPHIINHLLLCAPAAETSTGELMKRHSSRAVVDCSR